MELIQNERQRDQLAALSALLAQVPDDMRDIVAAQVIGTINGAIIATRIEQQKQSA